MKLVQAYFFRRRSRLSLFSGGFLVFSATLLLTACGRGNASREVAYVTVPQLYLRDQVAATYHKVELVKNGDRLEVLERARRFVRVRTNGGKEGWVEQRYLTGQDTFDQLLKLAAEYKSASVQGSGTTRNDTNIHLLPARDADHIYQVKEGEQVQVLKRATSPKPQTALLIPVKQPTGRKLEEKPAMEDWWLVRDTQGHTGWVLSRMIDLNIPIEISQYAEGQRIVGAFQLDEVNDGEKKVPQYVVALSEPKDGMPFDFNQVRVFTWNLKRHRYETAYRERKLSGFLPVNVARESFDKEGNLPVFEIHLKDVDGNVVQRKYKLNGPIVRRVLTPEEQQSTATQKRPGHRSRPQP